MKNLLIIVLFVLMLQAAPLKSTAADPDYIELLQARIDAATKKIAIVDVSCKAGTATVRQMNNARIALLTAEAELYKAAGEKEKLLKTLQSKVELTQNNAKYCQLAVDTGNKNAGITQLDLIDVKLAVKEAEYELSQYIVDTTTQKGVQRIVERFFSQNFRDITARKTIAWGELEKADNSNVSLVYEYEATILNKDIIKQKKRFTFAEDGALVKIEDVK